MNIEGDKHLAEVVGLIERERPEVVCLQEVFEKDFKTFLDKFKMRGMFTPTVFIDEPGKPRFRKRGVFGIAMMGKLPGKFGSDYYFKRRPKELPKYRGKPNAVNRALVWQEIDKGPTVASTHFTWSKGGKATEKQRKELKGLIKLLVNKVRPDVLCGDFNAPRGGEIWGRLAKKFVDNIPPAVRTTLNPKLHYANGVELVVDGFFTAPESKYRVKSIKLIGGVSDHLAIATVVNLTD